MTNDKADISANFNQVSSGSFPDNSTRSILPIHLRAFVASVLGGFVNLFDNAFNGVRGVKPAVTNLTGLKAVSTIALDTTVHITFRDTGTSDLLRVYELVAGTDAESSPDIIRPTDFNSTSNAKVWKRAFLGASVVSGTEVFCGLCDLSGNLFSTTGGTGSGGSVLKGNKFKNIGASTTLHDENGDIIPKGAMCMAAVDAPSSTSASDWIIWYTVTT